jgi:hypothetical protein
MKSTTNLNNQPETTDSRTETASTEALVRALRRLLEGDEQEQRETFEHLKNALN